MAGYTFEGGDKLTATLKKIAKKAGEDKLLKVGFFEESTESKSGISTAYVAACNEFGGTIPARTVKAGQNKLYRRISETGEFLGGGKFTKKAQANFESDVKEHTIPEHTVPARPFFRRMIKLGEKHWGDDFAAMLKHHELDVDKAAQELGMQMEDELKQSIADRVYAPLKPATIAAKGNDQTLIDSNDMQNAVMFKVE